MANEALTDQEKEFRKRARRRLIGAVALVLLMVTVLPMLLDDRSDENAPRPDVTISIPSQDDGEFSSKIVPVTPSQPAPAPVAVPGNEPVAPPPVEPVVAPTQAAPAAPAPAPAPAPVAPPEAKAIEPAPPVPAKVVTQPTEKAVPKPEPVAEAKPQPSAPAEKTSPKQGAVSVQIGVFTPSPKAEQIQSRLSGLGLDCGAETLNTKTGGKLLRMRCGPFASKDEALQAQQKLKASGYNNTILVAHQ